jgi:sorting nexin-29
VRFQENKSPRSDSLPVELYKSGGKALERWIHEIMMEVWNSEVSPEEWNKVIIVPIHKKRSQLHCENFRGITLLNIGYKIFSNILYERLKPFVENILGHYQKGFRAGKSTTDQIFFL